jgi:hypothetical protein
MVESNQRSAGRARLERLRDRDGDNCLHCGKAMVFDGFHCDPRAASIEHIIPIARGGGSKLFNLALAHRHCNIKRATKPLSQEAKVAELTNPPGLFCHDCLAPMPDFDALVLHRLVEHGMLSTRWVVKTPRWPADIRVPPRPLCRGLA